CCKTLQRAPQPAADVVADDNFSAWHTAAHKKFAIAERHATYLVLKRSHLLLLDTPAPRVRCVFNSDDVVKKISSLLGRPLRPVLEPPRLRRRRSGRRRRCGRLADRHAGSRQISHPLAGRRPRRKRPRETSA